MVQVIIVITQIGKAEGLTTQYKPLSLAMMCETYLICFSLSFSK